MFCKKCGKELENEWRTCPYCGANNGMLQETNVCKEVESESLLYNVTGWRRTGKFSFKEFKSEIKIRGNNIHVRIGAKKERVAEFLIKDIQKISFSYEPEWYISDIVRVVIFLLLLPVTYGLSVFAIIVSLYIASSRHLVITLPDKRKVKIPICQKADISDILKVLGYPEVEIEKNERKRVSDRTFRIMEWVCTVILLTVGASTLAFGMERFVANRTIPDSEIKMEIPEDEQSLTENEVESYVDTNTFSDVQEVGGDLESIIFPVTVINNTGVDIYKFYASLPETDSWEEDILGEDILYSGDSYIIDFQLTADELIWDFAMADSDDNIIEFYSMDFSECSTDGATLILEYDGTQGHAYLE